MMSRRQLLKAGTLATVAIWTYPDFTVTPERIDIWEHARRLSGLIRNALGKETGRCGEIGSDITWCKMEDSYFLRAKSFLDDFYMLYGGACIPEDMADFDLPMEFKSRRGAEFCYESYKGDYHLRSRRIIQVIKSPQKDASLRLSYAPEQNGKIGALDEVCAFIEADGTCHSASYKRGKDWESAGDDMFPRSIENQDFLFGIKIAREIAYETTGEKILHFSGLAQAVKLIGA